MRKVLYILSLPALVSCTTDTLGLDAGPTPRDAGTAPRDGGQRDGGTAPRDGGPMLYDAGVDGGVVDAGFERDGGCGPGTPQVDHDPFIVIFHGPQIDQDLTLRNLQTGGLEIEIVGVRSDEPESVNDFIVVGCETFPCTLEPAICGGDERVLPMRYLNDDGSNTDVAELELQTNSPGTETVIVQLQGLRSKCAGPQPVINVVTANPTVGQPVQIEALSTNPGGFPGLPAQITTWNWTWIFAPEPPVITGQGTPQIEFTPSVGGMYFLQLSVENDCWAGAISANVMINVSP